MKDTIDFFKFIIILSNYFHKKLVNEVVNKFLQNKKYWVWKLQLYFKFYAKQNKSIWFNQFFFKNWIILIYQLSLMYVFNTCWYFKYLWANCAWHKLFIFFQKSNTSNVFCIHECFFENLNSSSKFFCCFLFNFGQIVFVCLF